MSISILDYPQSGSTTTEPTPVQIHTQTEMFESDPSVKMGVSFLATGNQKIGRAHV